jgi:hypothetical protein
MSDAETRLRELEESGEATFQEQSYFGPLPVIRLTRSANMTETQEPEETACQIEPLYLDEREIKDELRKRLKHEPTDADIRVTKIDREAQHVLGSRIDRDRALRALIFFEYAITTLEREVFGVEFERPWTTVKGRNGEYLYPNIQAVFDALFERERLREGLLRK